MTIRELEKMAAAQSPMAEGLNAAEQLAFLSMRILYIQHALGKLTIEQAKQEKTRIIKEYDTNVLLLRSWEAAHEKERKLAPVLPLLKDSGCETCRRFFYILSGYKGECHNDDV